MVPPTSFFAEITSTVLVNIRNEPAPERAAAVMQLSAGALFEGSQQGF